MPSSPRPARPLRPHARPSVRVSDRELAERAAVPAAAARRLAWPAARTVLIGLPRAELQRPALPVLLASGYADALGGQVDVPVIAKPYRVEQVAERLWQAMRGPRGLAT
jgi:hypothetical protein